MKYKIASLFSMIILALALTSTKSSRAIEQSTEIKPDHPAVRFAIAPLFIPWKFNDVGIGEAVVEVKVNAQRIFHEQRVPPGDFVVMSWGPTPADPKQLQLMKEAGINVAGLARVKDLPVFEEAGLSVFVSDPRANGYDFEKPLDENLVRRNIESLAKEVGASSAVIGFMLRDEPHARAMPNLGLVARLIR